MATIAGNTEYLTTTEAAELMRSSEQLLAEWRYTGRVGLRFTKIGRKVLYRRKDVETFMERNSGTSCAEIAAAQA